MAIIRVTKEFKFEAAHALLGYDGLCKNIHGHSYILYVTVMGTPIEDQNNTKLGMVYDFGDLKFIVNNEIVKKFDHSIILNKNADTDNFDGLTEMFSRKHYTNYQPTCENMVIDFVGKIRKHLPDNIKLYSVKLYETATSYAEWVVTDNE
jgi:6-pyruvoyltetrahydropterin/6-carboxytetrahydropterin synthase